MMSRESVRRAVEEFRTRPTDVIVATFPKTGTTLVTWICHLLRTDALPFEDERAIDFETLYEVVPWPTLSWDIGYDPNVQGSEFYPRVFKSHLRMASVYPGCKYVVTIRDPAKTGLSFYNFCIAKKIPFVVDTENENKPRMDLSAFLVGTHFVKGIPKTPTSDLRPSIWDFYAEYHALMECPSVLILVYEDFLKEEETKRNQIRRLGRFLGITSGDERAREDDLVDRTAALSTKEYMAKHVSKFDEPYERAKELNRAADISQLAPGAKVATKAHKQTLDDRARAFLEDGWKQSMEPLGYKNYEEFAVAVRERNQRLFGTLS